MYSFGKDLTSLDGHAEHMAGVPHGVVPNQPMEAGISSHLWSVVKLAFLVDGPEKRPRSWRRTIQATSRRIAELMKSPMNAAPQSIHSAATR